MTDALTGLATHRDLQPSAFDDNALAIFVDIDGFRWVTCEQGFEAGDRILASLSRVVAHRATASVSARTYRVGGDEFLVLLPNSTPDSAVALARSLVEDVRKMQVAYSRSDQPSRTTLEVNAVVVRIRAATFSTYVGPHGVTEAFRDWVQPAIDAKRLETGINAGVVALCGVDERPS